MNHILTNVETDRLKFRLLKPDDFDAWLPLFYEDNVADFLGMDKSLSAKQMCEKWFEKSFGRYENNLGGMNALEDKATGKLIGQSGVLIQTVEDEQRIEVGYSILPEFWNNGYASEASSRCLEYAFENKLASTVISIVHVDNIGSEKVARNNGMSVEKSINYHGSPVRIFSISESHWKGLRLK